MATADQWVAAFARELGRDELTPEEVAGILELARVAAHSSERWAAPLACWLAAGSGLSPDRALEVAESVALPDQTDA